MDDDDTDTNIKNLNHELALLEQKERSERFRTSLQRYYDKKALLLFIIVILALMVVLNLMENKPSLPHVFILGFAIYKYATT